MPKSKNESLLPSRTPACSAVIIRMAPQSLGMGRASDRGVLWSSPEDEGPASEAAESALSDCCEFTSSELSVSPQFLSDFSIKCTSCKSTGK